MQMQTITVMAGSKVAFSKSLGIHRFFCLLLYHGFSAHLLCIPLIFSSSISASLWIVLSYNIAQYGFPSSNSEWTFRLSTQIFLQISSFILLCAYNWLIPIHYGFLVYNIISDSVNCVALSGHRFKHCYLKVKLKYSL